LTIGDLGSKRSSTLGPLGNPQSKIEKFFGGLGGIQTLSRSLQDFYAVVTSPAPRDFANFRLMIADLRVSAHWQPAIANRNSLVAEAGVEPARFRL
jgi:hypothetical protein